MYHNIQHREFLKENIVKFKDQDYGFAEETQGGVTTYSLALQYLAHTYSKS
jgi:hypothetical protein